MPPSGNREHPGRPVENQAVRSNAPMLGHPDGLVCPHCASTNTKFTFFNNRVRSQPRYRCLECGKSWTVGGKIRGPYNKRWVGGYFPRRPRTKRN